MSSTVSPEASPSEHDLRMDLAAAADLGAAEAYGDVRVGMARGQRNLWFRLALRDRQVAAIRVGLNAGEIANLQPWSKRDGSFGVDFSTALGGMRAKLAWSGRGTLRCTTSILPSDALRLTATPRDVLMADPDSGTIFTKQRGLRSGIVFAGSAAPTAFSLFYYQQFSTLSDFFGETNQTPADSVGGSWPEIGFALPSGPDALLARDRECIVSDAYITLLAQLPHTEEEIAGAYLDLFAETYLAIERPVTQYHPWNQRAADALRDVSFSPACTYERHGQRFLMPDIGDTTKPPESMVQLTVAVNVGEYDSWRGERSALGSRLRSTLNAFYREDIGTLVRWLPGETFDAAQADDNMNHEAMDSWYLHHALFNAARLAREGDAEALKVFAESLPFVKRVAWRFTYHWPIFFNVETLDVIRAEAAPGSGGETDVAGLYALVMIHAYEMLGGIDYLHEAESALSALHGHGFRLAYQLNTTGFAAEAAMRMYKHTGDTQYLGLSEVCLANIFDNMWLWECDYGNARHYPTFFGLFPLRDAPYIAPYEELEAHAKFHEFLTLGGDDVRPSLRLLIGEFQKYSLNRCWFYYPDQLPADVLSDTVRNGRLERSLSVPIEDMQDGREASGQVDQELYGAGMPFVMAARHYMDIAHHALLAYSNYPMYDFRDESSRAWWRAGGDPRCQAELRIIPRSIDGQSFAVSAWTTVGENRIALSGSTSAEGHAVFVIRGGQTIEVHWVESDIAVDGQIIVGPLSAVET